MYFNDYDDELFGGYSWYRHGLLMRGIGTLGLGIRGQGGSALEALRLFANQPVMECLSVIRRASPFVADAGWRQARAPGMPHALETTLVRGGLLEPARGPPAKGRRSHDDAGRARLGAWKPSSP